MTKAEKLAERIATGRRKFVSVERDMLPEVARIIKNNYYGTVTWFGLGTALCIRDKKEPMELKNKVS